MCIARECNPFDETKFRSRGSVLRFLLPPSLGSFDRPSCVSSIVGSKFPLFTRCLFVPVPRRSRLAVLAVNSGIRGHVSRVRRPEPEELSRSDRDVHVVWKPWDQRYIVVARVLRKRERATRDTVGLSLVFFSSRGEGRP